MVAPESKRDLDLAKMDLLLLRHRKTLMMVGGLSFSVCLSVCLSPFLSLSLSLFLTPSPSISISSLSFSLLLSPSLRLSLSLSHTHTHALFSITRKVKVSRFLLLNDIMICMGAKHNFCLQHRYNILIT